MHCTFCTSPDLKSITFASGKNKYEVFDKGKKSKQKYIITICLLIISKYSANILITNVNLYVYTFINLISR